MPLSDTSWTWQRQYVIPSDVQQGRRVLDELLRELEAQHWSRHDIFCIHLAVHEALMNAILHGNEGDPKKSVSVTSQLSPSGVRVQITDEGKGFDPQTLPDPKDSTHLDRLGGRGVLLMRSFMGRVCYPPPGNSVILERNRSPAS